ncbi:pyrroline-5-carboxylate reductase [Jejuia pallidilutea]|uniref:Pyrroline-5-carboxylate reductase n=1 Tax=Jejuia pallidilutea TaxID=504487 RepID=A0A090W6L4_9FLAO|nr:pyrroline-5-carboxylate reductase [Jejuia pallidilutea]PQV48331.1 pyrroline-5-carboxylate reductase [Jejuia pallidilutea]GAL71074.1 pyrroline-5-carboxylate reductase [Jejuia pallidilutea]GAL88160.1 pyrroline-5-carboxylate reductase [Jejuia pallidilutea]
MKIAIIGTGNLGSSIAKGLISNKSFTSLYLSDKNTAAVKVFNEEDYVTVTSDNVLAVEKSDIVIFALQPRHIDKVLELVKPKLTDNHVVMSVAAGVEISRIERILGSDTNIIRVMPNTAISIGKSMTCIAANSKAQDKVEMAETIFNQLGTTLIIPEELIQAATVICASGIAFWMRLVRATTQGAIQLGFEAEQAHELATQTCYGAASLLIESGRHPEQEIDRVTTPSGCTIEGLNAMEHQGLSSALIQGIVASFEKINQLKTT